MQKDSRNIPFQFDRAWLQLEFFKSYFNYIFIFNTKYNFHLIILDQAEINSPTTEVKFSSSNFYQGTLFCVHYKFKNSYFISAIE